jgi:hypothetical protein
LLPEPPIRLIFVLASSGVIFFAFAVFLASIVAVAETLIVECYSDEIIVLLYILQKYFCIC